MSNSIQFPFILDGGLSNALEQEGADLNHELWSAKLLMNDSTLIEKAHYNYYRVGANCVITSSYQATVEGFQKIGKSRKEGIELLQKTSQIANNARRKFIKENPSSQAYIAGSIGPYGAFLADGSEYRGDYNKSIDELISFHKERFDIIDATEIDFLACETIPCFDEVKAITTLLESAKHKGWISCSCKDEKHLNDGTPISEIAKYLLEHTAVFALGVNCTKPEYISSLIKEIRKVNKEIKIVVYPNSGQVYHADTKTWSGISDPSHCSLMAKEWIELGASVVGGCCQMGYEHISSMKKAIS